ncbi:Glutaredoxin [compost metagenome]
MYIVYSKPDCPTCDEAKMLLESKGAKYSVYVLGKDYDVDHLMEVVDSLNTAPPRSFPFIVKTTDHNVADEAIYNLIQLKEALKND